MTPRGGAIKMHRCHCIRSCGFFPRSSGRSTAACLSSRSRARCSRRGFRFRQPRSRRANDRRRSTRGGAFAAITAVVSGVPTLGLDADELERFLARDGVRKVSARDIPVAVAQGADGATTVAASLVPSPSRRASTVFATGGIGGVHRDAPFDESADLVELARTPMVVVCAGAKSILDLPATLERLETLGVPVIGYRTDELPGFFTARHGPPARRRGPTTPRRKSPTIFRAASGARADRRRCSSSSPARRRRPATGRVVDAGGREALAGGARERDPGRRGHALPARRRESCDGGQIARREPRLCSSRTPSLAGAIASGSLRDERSSCVE